MTHWQTEYMRKYRATPEGYKISTISSWKYLGLKGNYEYIFHRYMATTHCDLCQSLLTKERKGGRQKHMEHDHKTGEFRNVVCQKCNLQKTDSVKGKNNTSGHKGVSYDKSRKVWRYRKMINGKDICRRNKSKIQLLCIKFALLILHRSKLVN